MTNCLLLSVLLFALGCGQDGGLQLASVEGVVTYQGKMLDHGKVVFIPEKGTSGPQAVSTIESDGTFRINTIQSKGAAIGWHTVLVHCRRPAQKAKAGVPPSQYGESLIPRKYSVKADSPLRFQVKEGRNEYSIVLE